MGNYVSETLNKCFGAESDINTSTTTHTTATCGTGNSFYARSEPLLPKSVYRSHLFSQEAKLLTEACADGDYDQIQLILSENTSIHINETDDLGLTALYNAALYNHLQICSLLLEMGADPNIANKNGETPLHVACKSGNLEMCKLMIRFGANYEIRFRGRSCLDLSVQGNYPSLVKYFLSICPSLLIGGSTQDKFINVLPSPKSSFTSKYSTSITSTSISNSFRNGNSFRNSHSLTFDHSDMELSDKSAPTAMIIAVSLNHVEIVRILLESEPNMELIDVRTGKTCLMIACEKGHYKIVHLLLADDQDKLSSVLQQSNDMENDWTCVHYAAAHNSSKCIQVITHLSQESHTVWSELRDRNGRTPLHLASLYGHFELVRLLLEYGVRTDIQDNEGKVPSDLASATLHYHHVMKVFKEFAQRNNPPAGPTVVVAPHQRYATPMRNQATHYV